MKNNSLNNSLRRIRYVTATAFIVAAGGLALTAMPAYAETPKDTARGSMGEKVDDTTITSKVKDAFAQDDKVSAQRISVTTNMGIVQLSGFASSPQDAERAVQVASKVPGVKQVKNDIEVEQSQRMPQQKPSSSY